MDVARFQEVLCGFVTQRLELAEAFLASAHEMAEDNAIGSRNAISRSYYAMHHAGRAAIFGHSRTDVTRHDKV